MRIGGENLPQCRFAHHKWHMTSSGLEIGPPRWEAGDELPVLRNLRRELCLTRNLPSRSVPGAPRAFCDAQGGAGEGQRLPGQ
jgi:hypothetical protein